MGANGDSRLGLSCISSFNLLQSNKLLKTQGVRSLARTVWGTGVVGLSGVSRYAVAPFCVVCNSNERVML